MFCKIQQNFLFLDSKTASQKIIETLEAKQQGQRKINFRLRDWGVSRQRYWGTPIPIINCDRCGAVPVPEKDLPVVLPQDVEFQGVSSPLKSMPSFYETTCPTCSNPATRETDTFDTFFESSWYYARFACKKQDHNMLDGRANYWAPVDQYVGGIEHAVLHLLYARFIHKTLRDAGLLNSDEPFIRLLTQGMVLNEGAKMSKSKGNVVDPEALITRFGVDTVRLFIIFAAPPEQNLEWSDSGVEGSHRFLKRLWAFGFENRQVITQENQNANDEALTFDWESVDGEQRNILRQLYEIVELAKFDYERLQLNTVVSSCMKLLNLLNKVPQAANDKSNIHAYIVQKGFSMLLRLLAPIAPHITHELWNELNYQGLILTAPWPKTSLSALKVDHIELSVQVNGKMRARIKVPANAEAKTIEDIATRDKAVNQAIANKPIKRVICVPGKLVNIVTGEA